MYGTFFNLTGAFIKKVAYYGFRIWTLDTRRHRMFAESETSGIELHMGTYKPIDWPLSLKLANNKPHLAKEMLSLFVADLPQFQARIKKAQTESDYEALQQHVHKLHGASCYCGAPRIRTIANELETALKTMNREVIDPLVTALEAEMKLVLESYEASDYD